MQLNLSNEISDQYDYMNDLKDQENFSRKTESLYSKFSFEIFDQYINQEFSEIKSYEEAIENFNLLDQFLEEHLYTPTYDVLEQLIKENRIFSKMIEIVVNKDYSKIVDEQLDVDNLLLLFSIDVYCKIEKIKIVRQDEKEIFDYEKNVKTDENIVREYLKEINKPLLSANQERELALKIRMGDKDAKKLFIESNLRFVVYIAKRYRGQGLEFLDLIQEGNMGLMRAVNRFDVSKGYRFVSFAEYWIKHYIKRAISTGSSTIKLPVRMKDDIRNYRSTIMTLEAELNRQPTIQEIADQMKISFSKAFMLYQYESIISIDTSIGKDKKITIRETIPSLEANTEDVVMKKSLKKELYNLFVKSNLKKTEIEALILRFGLNGNDPMTFEKIGEIYHVSRETIRQRVEKALKKIRNSEYLEALLVYTDDHEGSLEKIKKLKKTV